MIIAAIAVISVVALGVSVVAIVLALALGAPDDQIRDMTGQH